MSLKRKSQPLRNTFSTLPQPLKIYIIAGEPSGDLLGAKVMKQLNQSCSIKPDYRGVGGPNMLENGLTESLIPLSDLSNMGFIQLLPFLFRLKRHINFVVNDIQKFSPNVLLTIDSKGFNFRVLNGLKKKQITSFFKCHYVGPTSVWTRKNGVERLHNLRSLIDHMFLLFPFETPFYKKIGFPFTYVGHPIVEDLSFVKKDSSFRSRHKIDSSTTLICLLPGSRRHEIEYIMPVFFKTVNQLKNDLPNLQIVIPTLPQFSENLNQQVKNWAVPTLVLSVTNQEEKYQIFKGCDLAVAVSGSVILELGIAGTPTIVVYKTNIIDAWIAKKMFSHLKYVSIPNLVLEKQLFPELLLENCTEEKVCHAVKLLLSDSQKREEQKEGMKQVLQQLSPHASSSPSELITSIILEKTNLSKSSF